MKNALLITGATGSIGQALCDVVYKNDIIPIIAYNRNILKAHELSEKYSSPEVSLDLSDAESIDHSVDQIIKFNLNLLGAILCASPNFEIAPFTKINLDHIDEQIKTNVIGNHKLLSSLIKKVFRKKKRGVIIGVLSEAMGKPLKAGSKYMTPYIVSKYGFLGLLSAMKAELNWLNVETISPGFTESNMLNVFDKRFLDNLRKNNQIKKPQNIAKEIFKVTKKALETDYE